MHNAEQFLHSKELPLPNKKQYTLASKEKVTGQVLGDSEAKNIKASQDAMEKNKKAVGVGANPKPGEAYGIIRQRAEPDVVQSPYHFAPVVARDGKQTLTVEQTAGRADAKTTNTAHPILDMYKVGDTKDSFQGRYGTKDGYGEDAIAIVAQKHGPETRDVTPEPSERPAKRRKLF
ncbi:hypothetical protein D7V88_06615 [Corallococcus terminator]|uniref:Uncharacterized protein n=2 Tax=Corallococcus terminator TaxID=2316733 RepID=A0A3A8JKD7_9BACT|nr:hypothetical protein D7V88_06615 [Corallococcus terminator]